MAWSHERGRAAEEAAARFLLGAGYTIVGRNVRVGKLEIDIIARMDDVVAIVEVRTRGAGAWLSSFQSIDRAKQQRLRKAGERLWRSRFRHDKSLQRMRFDAIAVALDDEPPCVEHIRAAF